MMGGGDARLLFRSTAPRIYLVAGSGSHLLRLDVPPRTSLYSFTFG
jgi:hypothetical protein